ENLLRHHSSRDEARSAAGAKMDRLHEATSDSLRPTDAVRVLDAVDGTLDALRQYALETGDTPEVRQILRRIDAYKGHLQRQRSVLDGTVTIEPNTHGAVADP